MIAMKWKPFAFVGTRDRSITISSYDCDLLKLLPLHHAHGTKLFTLRSHGLTDIELLLVSKLEHEIDHLHRFLGTTLGLFLYCCFSKQVELVLQHIRESSGELQLPFHKQSESMQYFEALVQLEKAMMSSTRKVCQMTESDLANSFQIGQFLGNGDLIRWDQGRSIAPHNRVIVGTVDCQSAISGYSILEYLGLSREVGIRRKFGLFYGETTEMIRTTDYQQLGQYWKQLRGDRNSEVKTAFPSELYLACDLACWIPFGPQGLVPRPSGGAYSWEDIHPGHRFTKILNVLDAVEPKSADAKLDEEYAKWFEAGTHAICERLDWPTPNQLATIWIDRLGKLKTEDSGWDRWIVDDEQRTHGTIKMLKLRLSHPAFAAQGYWSAFNQECLWFSCVTHQNQSERSQTIYSIGDKVGSSEYQLPLAVSLSFAIDQLVLKRPESLIGEELFQRFKTHTKKAIADLSKYANKRFGFSIESGRFQV